MLVLEVRHFELVVAIAETGSVARASDRLNLSQPALSHALRSLEDRLGVRLFERARRMSPTPEGERIRDAGEQILALVRQTEGELERRRRGELARVRVATECYTCYRWLPATIRQLRASLPGVSVQIVPDATARPIQALLDGELDIAIVHDKPSHRRLAVERLFVDEMVAVVAPDHPFATRAFVTPDDFEHERLLLHTGLERSVVWSSFLEPAGVRPAEIANLGLTEAIVESVKAGLGVSVLARWAIADELAARSIRAVRLGRLGLRRSWYAATLKSHQQPATAAFLALLKSDALKGWRAPAPQKAKPQTSRRVADVVMIGDRHARR